MAELVSIRSSTEKERNSDSGHKIAAKVAIANPAYSNDIESTNPRSMPSNGNAKTGPSPVGTTISFRDVTYTVDVKVKRKKVAKQIVKGIRYGPISEQVVNQTTASKSFEICHSSAIAACH